MTPVTWLKSTEAGVVEAPIEELTLEEAVFQKLGDASMCWSETPRGIFDSTRAKVIGDDLLRRVRMEATPA